MISQFNKWINSRKIRSIEDLPEQFQKELKEFIALYKPDKIYLVGSFYNGDWITDKTPQKFRELKKQVKYKDKLSDLDIVVEPDIDLTNYKSIHINKMQISNKALIYDGFS